VDWPGASSEDIKNDSGRKHRWADRTFDKFIKFNFGLFELTPKLASRVEILTAF